MGCHPVLYIFTNDNQFQGNDFIIAKTKNGKYRLNTLIF